MRGERTLIIIKVGLHLLSFARRAKPFRTDPKDQRSLNVRAAATIADEQRAEQEQEEAVNKPPTAAAIDQGHKPSRGAVIDEQIQQDELQTLKNKEKI